jgi:hypothetical protein
MTTLKNTTPTPAQFATAVRDRFADTIKNAAGADGRLSVSEAKKIAGKDDPEWIVADNAVDTIEKAGQKTMRAEKLLGRIYDDALASAEAVAGPNQKLSLLEARLLPKNLQAEFFYLRGKGLPDRVEPQDVKSYAAGVVMAAMDTNSLTKLSGPPWQVMGKDPVIESLQHPATGTRAIIYVVDDQIYFSRASPAGPGTAYVGWYHAGALPPALVDNG